MLKVLIIFALIVCAIMFCTNATDKKTSLKTEKEGGTIESDVDLSDYGKKNAKSIQDDIKKIVSKKI